MCCDGLSMNVQMKVLILCFRMGVRNSGWRVLIQNLENLVLGNWFYSPLFELICLSKKTNIKWLTELIVNITVWKMMSDFNAICWKFQIKAFSSDKEHAENMHNTKANLALEILINLLMVKI